MNRSSFTILSNSKNYAIEAGNNKDFQISKSEVPELNRKLSLEPTPQQPNINSSVVEASSIVPESRACIPNVYREITYKDALDNLDISENFLCKRTEKSPLFLIENPIIIVDKPQMIKKSLFSSKLTIYNVRAVNFNTIVQRTFEDFLWLKAILTDIYPNCYVSMLLLYNFRYQHSQKKHFSITKVM